MTDKDYETQLKGVDCCQNCAMFSLGMHFDGCPMGWCYQGEWDTHYRDDICNKFVRRVDNG